MVEDGFVLKTTANGSLAADKRQPRMFLRLTSFPIKSTTKTSDGQRFFSGCHHVIIDLYLCLHLLGLILSLIYYVYGLVLDRFGSQDGSFALDFRVISA